MNVEIKNLIRCNKGRSIIEYNHKEIRALVVRECWNNNIIRCNEGRNAKKVRKKRMKIKSSLVCNLKEPNLEEAWESENENLRLCGAEERGGMKNGTM